MGEDGIKALAVLAGGPNPGAIHGAHDQRRHRLAAEHVAEFGGLVEDLIETDTHEINEHEEQHC